MHVREIPVYILVEWSWLKVYDSPSIVYVLAGLYVTGISPHIQRPDKCTLNFGYTRRQWRSQRAEVDNHIGGVTQIKTNNLYWKTTKGISKSRIIDACLHPNEGVSPSFGSSINIIMPLKALRAGETTTGCPCSKFTRDGLTLSCHMIVLKVIMKVTEKD